MGEHRDGIVHDAVMVGLGPSNLALAVALDEVATPLDALFLEQKPEFSWQGGMLVTDARMQVSCLKDLATLRDPRSRFTFLQYLKVQGRLDRFVNLGTLRPTRAEFNDYLTWAADQVSARVRYSQEVLSVEPVPIDGTERVETLRVWAVDRRTGRSHACLTRNLVLGAGAPAHLPDGVTVAGSRRMCHASGVLTHLADHFPDLDAHLHLVVVGDGQSGAEIFRHLDTRYRRARVTAVTRGIGYRPVDETPFVNEIFFPGWVDVFQSLDRERRAALLGRFRNTNYAAVDPELIQTIYRSLYEAEVEGSRRLQVRPFLDVRAAADRPDGVTLELQDWLSGKAVRIDADGVVFATGYAGSNPHPLLARLGAYLGTDGTGAHEVGRDYRVATVPTFTPGIFLQGYAESTHGLSDGLLSIVGVRAGEIAATLQSLTAPQVRPDGAPRVRP